MNGTMTSPIVRTIVASHRALREGLSRLWELLQDGSVMEWPDEDPPAEPTQMTTVLPAPRLRLLRNSFDNVPAFKRPPGNR